MITLSVDEKKEFALALAAMLHDVGKVAQRYTPGKTHASLGQSFIRNLPNLDKDTKDLVSRLVGEHHVHDVSSSSLETEDRYLLTILQDADRKSASHDRDDRDPEEFREDPRIHNIYEYISLPDKLQRKSQRSFNLVTLESMVKIREGADPLIFEDITYNKIWSDLEREISKISQREFKGFFDSLDSILMNYLTFVPSAFYYSEPNITLYDHLRLTAAIALSEYRNKKSDNKGNVIFVMGEASGIQKYIFNYMTAESADEKATKRLRGRSFLVRLVVDSIVSLIMDRLGIFRFNVIWEKSDGFLIVVDSSAENEQKLQRIREEVELGLFDFNRGLSVALTWEKMPLEFMENANNDSFRGILDSLAKNISARKKRLLDTLMRGKWSIISDVEDPSGKICRFCGLSRISKDDRCDHCRMEENIGEALVKFGRIRKRNSDKGFLSLKFGSTFYSYDFDDDPSEDSSGSIYVNSFDHSNSRNGTRTILQGNFSPSSRNSVKPLNELLCSFRESGERCLYLGLTKIDIDNMGLIVTEGTDHLTLSKYASLSGLTSVFFSIVINAIAEKWNVYVIYSGGDDMTAMGEATSVVSFASAVRNAFSQWVRNDDITLSAGISLSDHSFPVRKSVEIASENLKIAKDRGKNALGVFGLYIPWKDVNNLLDVSDRIVRLVSGDEKGDQRLGKSFPMVLLNLDKENPYIENKFTVSGDTIKRNVRVRIPDSFIFYYLKRNLPRSNNEEVRQITTLISDKDVFSNVRFVAYNTIINMRRNEYGKQKN